MSLKILIVDDLEELREVTRMIIESLDFSKEPIFFEASSASSAIEIVEKEGPFDYIICDHEMNGDDGNKLFYAIDKTNFEGKYFIASSRKWNWLSEYYEKSVDFNYKYINKAEQYPDSLTKEFLKEKNSEYRKVRVGFFYKYKKAAGDIFIKIGGEKYIRIQVEGDDISPKDFKKYVDKGLSHLYLDEDDFRKYIKELVNEFENIDHSDAHKIFHLLGDIMVDEAKIPKEINEMIAKAQKEIVTFFNKINFKEKKEIEELFNKIKDPNNKIFGHNQLLILLTSLLEKKLSLSKHFESDADWYTNMILAINIHDIFVCESVFNKENIIENDNHGEKAAKLYLRMKNSKDKEDRFYQAIKYHHNLIHDVNEVKRITKENKKHVYFRDLELTPAIFALLHNVSNFVTFESSKKEDILIHLEVISERINHPNSMVRKSLNIVKDFIKNEY